MTNSSSRAFYYDIAPAKIIYVIIINSNYKIPNVQLLKIFCVSLSTYSSLLRLSDRQSLYYRKRNPMPTRQSSIYLPCVIFLTSFLAAPAWTAEKNKIETDYVAGAVLTGAQEKIVLDLAMQRGIKKVAKISTYYLLPTDARGIQVQSVEQIKGRDVTSQILNISYKKWWLPNEGPAKNDLQIGDFWASSPSIRKETILKLGKKEYRARTIQGLSLKEAEAILQMLLEPNYTEEPAVRQENFKQIAWDKPLSFRKRGENYSVSFPHAARGAGFFDLQIKMDDGELIIQQMFQAVP